MILCLRQSGVKQGWHTGLGRRLKARQVSAGERWHCASVTPKKWRDSVVETPIFCDGGGWPLGKEAYRTVIVGQECKIHYRYIKHQLVSGAQRQAFRLWQRHGLKSSWKLSLGKKKKSVEYVRKTYPECSPVFPLEWPKDQQSWHGGCTMVPATTWTISDKSNLRTKRHLLRQKYISNLIVYYFYTRIISWLGLRCGWWAGRRGLNTSQDLRCCMWCDLRVANGDWNNTRQHERHHSRRGLWRLADTQQWLGNRLDTKQKNGGNRRLIRITWGI